MKKREPQTYRFETFHSLVQCESCRSIHSLLLKAPKHHTKIELGRCRVVTGRGFACGGELYLLHRTSHAVFTEVADSREGTT